MADEFSTQTSANNTCTARAFAKVNLHLAVGPARPDGFHELVTIFQSLDLADTVRITCAEAESDSSVVSDDSGLHESNPGHSVAHDSPIHGTLVQALTVTGRDSEAVPTDVTNLAWQAVDAVAAALRAAHTKELTLPQVTIAINKNIPVAGGMAGGSADAAAALRAANALFSSYAGVSALDEQVIHKLAAQLGSDVPFCLHGHTALGQGRGEKLHAVPTTGIYHWALVANAQGLSTPRVFAVFDEIVERDTLVGKQPQKNPIPSETASLAAALQAGDAQQLAGLLRNDLQQSALHIRPDLREILDTGEHAGALAGIVSGSGPTCAFLCADEQAARQVAAEVEMKIAGTRGIIATSPAARAELVES